MNLKSTFCTMRLWKEISCKAYLFFNIFSDDLHVATLIIGLYLVSLIIGKALGEGTI